MAIEFTPKNSLEQALREHDRAQVVRFIAEGDKLSGNRPAAWLAGSDFPPEVVQLVLKLALTREQLKAMDNYYWHFRNGARELDIPVMLALAPPPDRPNAAEKHLIDAVVRADSAKVVELVKKKPGTLRNFSPELLIMLPELTREAILEFLANGFAPAAVPELFALLLRETESPDVLDSFSYRERLMYANLLIHILQGEAVSPDEDWYPMGNSIEDGCDKSVYCHSYDYCYDPLHRYCPRFADDEYEKPEHDIRRA